MLAFLAGCMRSSSIVCKRGEGEDETGGGADWMLQAVGMGLEGMKGQSPWQMRLQGGPHAPFSAALMRLSHCVSSSAANFSKRAGVTGVRMEKSKESA